MFKDPKADTGVPGPGQPELILLWLESEDEVVFFSQLTSRNRIVHSAHSWC